MFILSFRRLFFSLPDYLITKIITAGLIHLQTPTGLFYLDVSVLEGSLWLNSPHCVCSVLFSFLVLKQRFAADPVYLRTHQTVHHVQVITALKRHDRKTRFWLLSKQELIMWIRVFAKINGKMFLWFGAERKEYYWG